MIYNFILTYYTRPTYLTNVVEKHEKKVRRYGNSEEEAKEEISKQYSKKPYFCEPSKLTLIDDNDKTEIINQIYKVTNYLSISKLKYSKAALFNMTKEKLEQIYNKLLIRKEEYDKTRK